MSTTVSLSEAKTHLTRLLTETETLGEHIIITRSGRPAGILLPVEEYEGLLETLEILADKEFSQALQQGLEDAERGEVIDHEDLWSELEDSLHE